MRALPRLVSGINPAARQVVKFYAFSCVGYIGRMAIDAVEIIRCPAELRAEALALVLCELAPSLRRDVAGGLLEIDDAAEFGNEPLFIARRGSSIARRGMGAAAVGQYRGVLAAAT